MNINDKDIIANCLGRINKAIEALENFDAVYGDKLWTLSLNDQTKPGEMLEEVRRILKNG